MNSTQLIDKIRKLLRLSKSSEPNEAALALRRARELMNKHGVTEAHIAMADIREHRAAAGNYKRPPEYISILAEACASLFQCTYYWNTRSALNLRTLRRTHETAPVFVGVEPNAEICGYCYDVLAAKLRRARANVYIPGRHRMTRREITVERDSYAWGWVEGVSRNIQELVPARPTGSEESTAGTELVAIDPLQAYLDQKDLGEMKSRDLAIAGPSLARGYRDGVEVDIHQGVRKSEAAQLQAG